MPRDEREDQVLEMLHALPEAKAMRAAALHYAVKRDKHGPTHPLTRDAEENLYRQMFACHPVAARALQEMMK